MFFNKLRRLFHHKKSSKAKKVSNINQFEEELINRSEPPKFATDNENVSQGQTPPKHEDMDSNQVNVASNTAVAIDPANHCVIYQLRTAKNNIILPVPLQKNAFEYPEIQFFSFSSNIIHYMLEVSTVKIYQKLCKTCKHFFSKKCVTVIPSVIMKADYGFRHPSRRLRFLSNQLHKIWITTFLHTDWDRTDGLSKFCSKIYKCQVIRLTIYSQNLTEKEFQFLAQPEFILSLSMVFTSVKRSNGSDIYLENIVERVPNAVVLDFRSIATNVHTFSHLAKLQGKNKLKYFWYSPGNSYNFHPEFDTEMFYHFVTKNAAPKATFSMILGFSTKELVDVDRKKIEKLLKNWTPQDQKPKISLDRIMP